MASASSSSTTDVHRSVATTSSSSATEVSESAGRTWSVASQTQRSPRSEHCVALHRSPLWPGPRPMRLTAVAQETYQHLRHIMELAPRQYHRYDPMRAAIQLPVRNLIRQVGVVRGAGIALSLGAAVPCWTLTAWNIIQAVTRTLYLAVSLLVLRVDNISMVGSIAFDGFEASMYGIAALILTLTTPVFLYAAAQEANEARYLHGIQRLRHRRAEEEYLFQNRRVPLQEIRVPRLALTNRKTFQRHWNLLEAPARQLIISSLSGKRVPQNP